MLWVSLDIELLDDPRFIRLQAADPRHLGMLLRLVQIAKRNDPAGGRICDLEGNPMTPGDLALVHHRTLEATIAWQTFLGEALDLGMLEKDEGTIRIASWDRWTRKPSDSREARAERKRAERERKRAAEGTPDASQGVTRQSRDVTQHSTAQHEHSMSTAQHEHSTAAAAPQPPTGGQGAPAARAAAAAAAPVASSGGNGRAGEEALSRTAITERLKRLRELDKPAHWATFTTFRQRASAGGAPDDAILMALDYGVDSASHEMNHGSKPVKKPWSLALTIAERILPTCIDRIRFREEQRSLGMPDPRPIRFRAPEQAGAGAPC